MVIFICPTSTTSNPMDKEACNSEKSNVAAKYYKSNYVESMLEYVTFLAKLWKHNSRTGITKQHFVIHKQCEITTASPFELSFPVITHYNKVVVRYVHPCCT